MILYTCVYVDTQVVYRSRTCIRSLTISSKTTLEGLHFTCHCCHLCLPVQSDDPQDLVTCSNLLTRFVVIIIEAHEALFSQTQDEILPDKLKWVPDTVLYMYTYICMYSLIAIICYVFWCVLSLPERKSSYVPNEMLSRKASWTSSVFDESGLERQATLRKIKKIPGG